MDLNNNTMVFETFYSELRFIACNRILEHNSRGNSGRVVSELNTLPTALHPTCLHPIEPLKPLRHIAYPVERAVAWFTIKVYSVVVHDR